MTILSVIDARPEAQDASETTPLTRADIRGEELRAFAGKKVIARTPIDPANTDRIEGILAALTFPMLLPELLDRIEAGLEEAAKRSGSVVPDQYRYGYGVDQNCGDDVAVVLKAHCGGGLKEPMDLSKLEEVVDTNGIRDRFDVWMTKGLNNGMLRMNTGNVLRGMVRNEKPVRIGDRAWNQPEA